jgi:hypothetical protein
MQSLDGKENQSCSGQSLTEYGLVGALVLVACIGGIAILGNSLRDSFASMITAPPAKPIAVASSPVSSIPASPSAPVLPSSVSSATLVSPNTLQIKLADGSTLNMNIPVDVAKSIQTIGANGTTQLLASSLEELAAQLKAEGKVDQTGSDAILKLANLAHRIASIESVVEGAMAKAGGDRQAALNMPVVFDGKSYAKVTDLTATIQTGSQLSDGSYNFGPQTKEFYDAFSALWSAGVMNDPKVAGIIDVYTHEIANLADGNRVVMTQMANSYGTPDAYRTQLANYMNSIGYNNTASKLSEKTGSAVTHVDSAAICTAGGRTDSGTNCKL